MTSLIGGVLAERWGGRHVVGISLFLSGVLTGLSPLMARDSFWPIFMARFALGVLGVSELMTLISLIIPDSTLLLVGN